MEVVTFALIWTRALANVMEHHFLQIPSEDEALMDALSSNKPSDVVYAWTREKIWNQYEGFLVLKASDDKAFHC